mmetsp:Transcript_22773/g.91232  ORF Transcript_22773/g.91232 Transcript_22773/m.91232 type:complete len:108 (-) Transcript_22773:2976-3299(-)
MIRRTMSAALRSGGVITKGERRLKTRSRVWCVNRSPFVHGKHKDHFWMRMRRILVSGGSISGVIKHYSPGLKKKTSTPPCFFSFTALRRNFSFPTSRMHMTRSRNRI